MTRGIGHKKAVNTDLYLAIFDAYKDVNPWSKQISVPHAKQGLQTDIVMGDDGFYAQYDSTMKTHFPKHTHEDQEEIEKEVPAGRPLGPPSAKTKVSVVFGDSMKHQPERLRSVATDHYVLYPGELIKAKNNPTKDKEKEERAKELNNWQSKKELMMSAAHIGTATRDDIPLDTRHFANFTSTNTDTYIAPKHVDPVIRFDLKPRGPTSIPEGDRDKQNSYATESTTSFVRHNIQPSGNERDRGFHTQRSNKALLGKSGEATEFQTTSQSIYQKPTSGFSDLSISVIKGQQRGRSSIAFGQHFEVPKSNFISHNQKQQSVTQRDFNSQQEERMPRLHLSEHHLPWSKNFVVETNNPDGIKTGMPSALQPDNRDAQYKSCATHDFVYVKDKKHKLVTGPEYTGTCNSETTYRSSIPTGDEAKFPSNKLATITSNSYPAYQGLKMPTFPVLGEKVTKSAFTLGDGLGVVEDEFCVSTAAASFVNHGRRVKNVEKCKNGQGLDMLKAVNEEYGMGENKTTNSVIYQFPTNAEITHTLEPKTVHSKLLFPLESHVKAETAYGTTTNAFHGMRPGILEVKQPQGIIARGHSSIVLGDKRHFTTRGDPVF
ncbi:hypothetical protein HDU79_001634 [Rhizoclosmatium sp. JEL0117]|nr:hypothetical protein HDU79_001634 [Rhizoclosmatium sp. JEL0117]